MQRSTVHPMGEQGAEDQDQESAEPQGGHAAERLHEFLRAREPVEDTDSATPEEDDDEVPPAHETGADAPQSHRNGSLLAPPDTPGPSDTEAD